MIKKLVKYGNSNALVLDRAILELLNIGEGSLVKLHTDGKSLIITPTETTKNSEISMSGLEMMAHATDIRVKQSQKAFEEADPVKKQQSEQFMPGTEKGIKLAEAFKNMMEKYQDDMLKLSTESFIQDVDLLAEKYHGDKSSHGFVEEFHVLRLKHAPNLANMDNEMHEVQKTMGMI